jgi:CDGSH-type Zn-finger protein
MKIIRPLSHTSLLGHRYLFSYFRPSITSVSYLSSWSDNQSFSINSGKINQKIDLTNERVVHTVIVKSGHRFVLCRCWKSNKFPYCDGSHKLHNKEFGDNIGPVVITCPSEVSPETTGNSDKAPPI